MPKVGGKHYSYTPAGMAAAKKAAAKKAAAKGVKPKTGIRSDDDSMIEDRRPLSPGGDEGVRRQQGANAQARYSAQKAYPKNSSKGGAATATKRAQRMGKSKPKISKSAKGK